MQINFKRLTESAVTPYRGTVSSAGYALIAAAPADIPPGENRLIETGLAMEIPEGYFGGIFARSGLSVKEGLRPANCVAVIDADYRGEVKVPLYNDSGSDKHVAKGERIAQLVLIPFLHADFNEVDELSDTGRGTGGFGSTG